MARPPSDPSGAKQTITIRLSPGHLARLDKLARDRDLNRSTVVSSLIDATKPSANQGTVTVTGTDPVTGCIHPGSQRTIEANGVTCGRCGAVQKPEGWRR